LAIFADLIYSAMGSLFQAGVGVRDGVDVISVISVIDVIDVIDVINVIGVINVINVIGVINVISDDDLLHDGNVVTGGGELALVQGLVSQVGDHRAVRQPLVQVLYRKITVFDMTLEFHSKWINK
jgi:hypothetical protein